MKPFAAIAVLMLLGGYLFFPQKMPGPWGAPDSDVPVISRGERVEIADHLQAGRRTVIEFTAEW